MPYQGLISKMVAEHRQYRTAHAPRRDAKRGAMMSKLKLAVYWASSCGGCDIAIVELGEHLLELAQVADIVFWPAAMDFKYADVEKPWKTSFIDVTLFNGSVHPQRWMKRSPGFCAGKVRCWWLSAPAPSEGCIPSLTNIKGPEYALNWALRGSPSTENPSGALPCGCLRDARRDA